ncbi:putative acyltransferase YihG [Marinomonas aquimarina]|uniref:Putative acyltransferase YihG n=2 Tax=Marinomonas aquimarina TaxID=295068 RepID=A0A1A8T3H9_9GAMM|nr:putative acyltransferase YihG [Marinomonas aquimarina]
MPRIFMKDTLRWLPLVGSATKLMGFPQVKRYSKAKLAKQPELAERDRQATQAACVALMQTPSSMMSFAEGTRFTARKHRQQKSPYQHLLRPKAGGLWAVLQAMPDRFECITDLNIVYQNGAPSFWDLLCGRVAHVFVTARYVEIPRAFQRIDHDTDKQAFYTWLNGYWQDKDVHLETDLRQCVMLEIKRNGPIKKGNGIQN